MTKKKKIIIISSAAVAAAAISLSVGLSIAYLGETKAKENTVIVGHGDVSIEESFPEVSEQSMLNEDMTKEVAVVNTGTVPSFARLYAEFSDSDIAAHAKVKVGDQTYSWEKFKTGLSLTDASAEGYIASDWRYVKDSNDGLCGYFYYTKKLNVKVDDESTGYKTTNLFDAVTLDYRRYNDQSSVVDGSNIDNIRPVEMIVYGELIQTVETGSTEVTVTPEEGGPYVSTVYGYDYGEKDEWRKAWESFLRVNSHTP